MPRTASLREGARIIERSKAPEDRRTPGRWRAFLHDDQNDGAHHQEGSGHAPAHDLGAEVLFGVHEPVADQPDEHHAEEAAGGIDDVGGGGLAKDGESADKNDALDAEQGGAADEPGPVSYTHLDVYKRQRLEREDVCDCAGGGTLTVTLPISRDILFGRGRRL